MPVPFTDRGADRLPSTPELLQQLGNELAALRAATIEQVAVPVTDLLDEAERIFAECTVRLVDLELRRADAIRQELELRRSLQRLGAVVDDTRSSLGPPRGRPAVPASFAVASAARRISSLSLWHRRRDPGEQAGAGHDDGRVHNPADPSDPPVPSDPPDPPARVASLDPSDALDRVASLDALVEHEPEGSAHGVAEDHSAPEDASARGVPNEPPHGPWAEEADAADLCVRLLGPFSVHERGRLVTAWHGQKSQRLLKFLVARHRRPTPRDVLIELLWPEIDPEVGRRNLHQAVYLLRRSLRDGSHDRHHIVFLHDCYLLDPTISLWVDAEAFDATVAAGRTAASAGDARGAADILAASMELYRGDYLEDAPYEEWAVPERERFRALYAEVANELAELQLQTGELDAALSTSRNLLGRDPCDELAHQRIMRVYAARGQRNLLVHQFRTCVEALRRTYELGPSPETLSVYRQFVGV